MTAFLAAFFFCAALSASDAPRQLEWDDLMPADWDLLAQLNKLRGGPEGAIEDGSPQADAIMRKFISAGQSAPVIPELDGQRVKIPGFVVPLDFEDKSLKEFLLVPYFGACIHVPPPPANQVVYVKTAKAHEFAGLYDPVWVTGTLRTQAHLNDVGNAGYTLEAVTIEAYKETN
jgi:hypothetical protein